MKRVPNVGALFVCGDVATRPGSYPLVGGNWPVQRKACAAWLEVVRMSISRTDPPAGAVTVLTTLP